MPRNELENFSNLRSPLFCPYLGSDVTVLHLLLEVRGRVVQCNCWLWTMDCVCRVVVDDLT